MKIRQGFILRDVGGKTFVVATGELSKEFSGLITLNETGKFIWQLLAEENTVDSIVDSLMKAYECDNREAIESDVRNFIALLEKDNVLE